jgi:hypothetical protein
MVRSLSTAASHETDTFQTAERPARRWACAFGTRAHPIVKPQKRVGRGRAGHARCSTRPRLFADRDRRNEHGCHRRGVERQQGDHLQHWPDKGALPEVMSSLHGPSRSSSRPPVTSAPMSSPSWAGIHPPVRSSPASCALDARRQAAGVQPGLAPPSARASAAAADGAAEAGRGRGELAGSRHRRPSPSCLAR